MLACLSNEDVLDLVRGSLDPAVHENAHRHIDGCETCRSLVAEVAAAEGGPSAEWSHLAPGAPIGRYRVREALGAGAMGAVFAADDPQLGRSVALKLLRAGAGRAAELRPRLLREAQVLARLSHPNVVVVHDVGFYGDELFVALELVSGGTLAEWLREQKRNLREIIGVFRQAGEGLAAAHAAGLVHRDFKPDNVLIGVDGRARVTDFGLARDLGETGAPVEEDAPADLPLRLTVTGALIGTPAYMAPEQFDGKRADARSDQFAFCVALYEAVYGERPFTATDLHALRDELRAGVFRSPPPGRNVPSWLRRILRRGLSVRPDHRFADMRALLLAIDAGSPFSPRRVTAAAAVLAILAAAGWRAEVQRRCDAVDAPWNAVWPAGSLQKLASSLGVSAPVVAYVDRSFGDYRKAGAAMEMQACRAARIRGEDAPDLYAARARCLREHRESALALERALLFEHPTTQGAAGAAAALPSLEECANARQLLSLPPPPDDPNQRAELEALRSALSEGTARSALRYGNAISLLQPLPEAARKLGARGLEARALLQLAISRSFEGIDEVAEEADLTAAANAALAARDDGAAADVFTRLAFHSGFHVARYDESRMFDSFARAAIARLGGDEAREAELDYVRTMVLINEDKPDEAQKTIARSRELFIRSRGPDFWRLSSVEQIAGAVAEAMGNLEEAVAAERRGQDLALRLLGRESWLYDDAQKNEGEALALLGRGEEAVAAYAGVEADLKRRGEAADSWFEQRYALALRAAGRFDAALERDRRALDLAGRERQEAVYASSSRLGIGLDLLGLGRPREALPWVEQAAAVREHGAPRDDVAEARFALARVLRAAGRESVRARKLALSARETYAALAERYGGWFVTTRTSVDRWLAER
ncbi:MAG: serine/threonine protein kinase [Myxococcales bacterium]|nr:serine/threonine protein kinase [Myxococcales bacterium]